MPIACSRFIWNTVHFAALRPSLGGFRPATARYRCASTG